MLSLVEWCATNKTKLSPTELGGRLDRILGATERLIAAVPGGQMDFQPPQRDRSLRDLAFHIFRLALAFADGMDLGRFPQERLAEPAPRDLHDGRAVGRYGALVRGRLAGWLEGAAPQEYARMIEVYDGPQSGHDLLERTTGHAAQHLRQLHVLLEDLGLSPGEPLPTADFEGLPLPETCW